MKVIVGVAGLALAAYMISRGWYFWPVVIALVSICASTETSL